MQGAYVWSLVGELKFHMPRGTAKIFFFLKEENVLLKRTWNYHKEISGKPKERVEEKIP